MALSIVMRNRSSLSRKASFERRASSIRLSAARRACLSSSFTFFSSSICAAASALVYPLCCKVDGLLPTPVPAGKKNNFLFFADSGIVFFFINIKMKATL
jgi:hypothetical protein